MSRMENSITVSELVLRWQELRDQGRSVSAEELCTGCPELLEELKRQIEALQSMQQFLDTSASGAPSAATPETLLTVVEVERQTSGQRGDDDATPGSDEPRVRSRYQPLRLHAKGGLGEVFVARDEELPREVALKRIRRPYAHNDDSRRRFLREGEITGSLEHPGVVPVYGLTQDAGGQPCYAMRFVRGQTLEEAIAQFHQTGQENRSLTLRQLLNRFVSVCNTLAYAHSRGVIHRDLKPSNIMLGDYGETLVIDWGLAKRLEENQSSAAPEGNGSPLSPRFDRPEGTATGELLGTPAFMSPEQAAGRNAAVGPASDVYSLGATLYALLTGRPPFAGDSLGELLEKVTRGDFPPLRQLRPDTPRALEAICLKAMALEPAARYATALELAADMERWLADEPVSACREPWQVRARRWVGRHRTLVTTAAVALLVVTVSLTVATVLLQAANRREHEALQKAEQQAAIATAVNDFLQKDLLGQADIGQQMVGPGGERDPDVKVRTLLDRAANSIEGKFTNQPLTEAAIRLTMGNAYRELGLYPESQRHLDRSLQLRTANLGADHPDTLTSKHDLAGLYLAQGRDDLAEPLHKEVLQARTVKLGADHPDTLTSKHNLAGLYQDQGKYDLAESLYQEVVQARITKLGADHPDTLRSKNALAVVYHYYQYKYDLAEPLYKEVVAGMTVKLGPDHPYTMDCKHSLAVLYLDQGKYDLAESHHKEVLDAMTAKHGRDHPNTLVIKNDLAVMYHSLGKYDLAEPLLKEVLQAATDKLGPDHPNTLQGKSHLADLYRDQGKYDLAESLYKEALRALRATGRTEHPYTLYTMVGLGMNLLRQERYAEAESILRQCLDICNKKQADLWITFEMRSWLGEALTGQKKYAEAEPLLVQGYEGMKEREKSIPAQIKVRLVEGVERLVQLYDAWGKKDKADDYRQQLAAERAKAQPQKK
jgi:tetratricopeptide (TPR) repeat protein/tRNA A-37 threonylcarbamoyl transferase component Bud32